MIQRSKPSLFDILFAWKGTILPRIGGRLALIVLASMGAVVAARAHPGIFAQISAFPFTLIGLALSIFMSFRNNACYARWWEGRQLWGALVIECRTIARQVATLSAGERERFVLGLCAFSAGLKARLRGDDEPGAIAAWWEGGSWQEAINPTNGVVHEMGVASQRLLAQGALDPMRWTALEQHLAALSGIQAGCERIAATPVPFAYSLLLHRTAYIFCLSLPFALAGALGWWAVLPSALVAYTFFGLDALGDQLEDPFGRDVNDLPLDAILRVIERDMLSALGRKDLPPVLKPVDNVLM
ncbi:bestrophin family protein [Novosphingobium rosa]|uniref:bestrophin family protein n=1 Tax=Novosphingobium rosa TaxID=76978 RepID=UPI00083566A4|nr:bestrophin family protein [Novosphingobium rosa]